MVLAWKTLVDNTIYQLHKNMIMPLPGDHNLVLQLVRRDEESGEREDGCALAATDGEDEVVVDNEYYWNMA